VIASKPQIHIVDSDGQNLKELDKIDGVNPVWSPDGKRLLFMRIAEDSTSLCIAYVDGANAQTLITRRGWFLMTGAWSPDRKRLAYSIPSEGLFLAKSDGSQPRRLVGGGSGGFGLRWSADGMRLFFSRVNAPKMIDEKSQLGVYVIDVDGQNLRRVTAEDERAYLGGNLLFAMRSLN
jgi:TolB protein